METNPKAASIAESTETQACRSHNHPSPALEGLRRIPDIILTNRDRSMIEIRRMLIREGKNDWAIAGVMASRLGMSRRTAEGRIARLVQAGIMEENPHKQEKRHCDQEELVEAYVELAKEGLCDGAIARMLSRRYLRPADSLKTDICRLRREGKLPENPNNQKPADEKEIAWLMRRRSELASIGLNDTSISRVLALESETRNSEAIRRALWELVKDGMLEMNVGKAGPSRQAERMILRRESLIREGRRDRYILRQMARESGYSRDTIMFLIWRIVNVGGCRVNPNG